MMERFNMNNTMIQEHPPYTNVVGAEEFQQMWEIITRWSISKEIVNNFDYNSYYTLGGTKW